MKSTMNFKTIKNSAIQTLNSLRRSVLILLSVILLISFILNAIPKEFYSKVFTGNSLIDSVIGAIVGSISAGNPINSYIVGGELLNQGVGLAAVTAFILAWVTVGLIQLPAESLMLGRKFALYRNGVSFVSSIVIALLTVSILSFF